MPRTWLIVRLVMPTLAFTTTSKTTTATGVPRSGAKAWSPGAAPSDIAMADAAAPCCKSAFRPLIDPSLTTVRCAPPQLPWYAWLTALAAGVKAVEPSMVRSPGAQVALTGTAEGHSR
jgi:hypothetical protein